MPTKTTKNGREYEVTGKKFVWHPLDDNDEAGNLPDVVIPLRIKLRTLRRFSGEELDNAVMFEMLEALIPDQADTLDEMDVNDFQIMFATWQREYNTLAGATPGE